MHKILLNYSKGAGHFCYEHISHLLINEGKNSEMELALVIALKSYRNNFLIVRYWKDSLHLSSIDGVIHLSSHSGNGHYF